jgi:hypothetical protein
MARQVQVKSEVANSAHNKEQWFSVSKELYPQLAAHSSERLAARIDSRQFTSQDVRNIAERKLDFIERSLELSPRQLDHARRLAGLSTIQLKEPPVASHRPYIGRIIVVVKRTLFHLVQPLLQETIKQQRAFNAALVEAYVDSCQPE